METVTVTGRVTMKESRYSGLDAFYLHTAEATYRLWSYILDPDHEKILAQLAEAAASGQDLTISGELSQDKKEKRIRIRAIRSADRGAED